MASSSCHPFIAMQFEDILEDSFYFSEAETDPEIQEDAFKRFSKAKTFWIQSRENKFLILTTDSTLKAQDLDSVERRQSDCEFNIQVYCDNCLDAMLGKPVMLYLHKDNQKMVVCCRSDRDVCAKPMQELPKQIPENNHEAMFYQTEIGANKYKFESTKYKKHFLAFEPDQESPRFHKLLLQHSNDAVDLTCQVVVSRIKK